ncbi:MAG: hypothetical protein ABIH99_03350 [Candidatus Micrarchaeota archaeon]
MKRTLPLFVLLLFVFGCTQPVNPPDNQTIPDNTSILNESNETINANCFKDGEYFQVGDLYYFNITGNPCCNTSAESISCGNTDEYGRCKLGICFYNTCAKCGDKSCGLGENFCNCPEDCKEEDFFKCPDSYNCSKKNEFKECPDFAQIEQNEDGTWRTWSEPDVGCIKDRQALEERYCSWLKKTCSNTTISE